MSSRLEQLEHSLLELGTEVFRLKNEMTTLTQYHESFVDIVKGLKAILDEKGLISRDDFDAAIDLGNAINLVGGAAADHPLLWQKESTKKAIN